MLEQSRSDNSLTPENNKPLRQRIFYGWWVVLAASVIGLWAGTIFYGIAALINPIARDMHWSYLEMSFALSLRSAEIGFLAPVTGYLSDKIGSRKVTFVAGICVGIGFLMLSRIENIFDFYMGFCVLAVGISGIGHVVTLTPIANWFKRNLGKAIGAVMAAYGLSGIFVPVIILLIDRFHWRGAFVAMAIMSWIMIFPMAFFLRQKPELYGLTVDGAPQSERDTPTDKVGQTKDADVLPKGRYFAAYPCLLDAFLYMWHFRHGLAYSRLIHSSTP